MKFLYFAAFLLVLMTYVAAQPSKGIRDVDDEKLSQADLEMFMKTFKDLIPNFGNLVKNAQLGHR